MLSRVQRLRSIGCTMNHGIIFWSRPHLQILGKVFIFSKEGWNPNIKDDQREDMMCSCPLCRKEYMKPLTVAKKIACTLDTAQPWTSKMDTNKAIWTGVRWLPWQKMGALKKRNVSALTSGYRVQPSGPLQIGGFSRTLLLYAVFLVHKKKMKLGLAI